MKLVIIESNAGDQTQKLDSKSVLNFPSLGLVWHSVKYDKFSHPKNNKEKRIFMSPSFLICSINEFLQQFQLSSNPLTLKVKVSPDI
ncbi:hypothetical protein H5410_010952 [Solanum commersonii]|uniref:Uncharacterized protein n=1 Tax=Solanum commersonii TaxID=4109 RepID=A0A9J6AM99_SOLCO|nr:hypothetical protein H5410_010952 [Solanum commersonii]